MPVVQLQRYAKNTISVYEAGQRSASMEFARELASLKSRQGERDAFFVGDVGHVPALVERWRAELPRVRPFYSVNCNADSVLLSQLAENPSVGFHCTTRQNVAAVLNATRQPQRCLYANPCWTRGALTAAAEDQLQLLAFDSARDLRRIAETCPDAGLMLNVCMVSNPEDPSSEFGCALADAVDLLNLAADNGLRCVGIGFNLGSGSVATRMFPSAIGCAAQLLRMARQAGHDLRVLNLGGGFAPEGRVFEAQAAQVRDALAQFLPPAEFPQLELLATPGRFFAASVFMLVTSVVHKQPVDASRLTNDDFDAGKTAFVYGTNQGYHGPFGCQNRNARPACAPLFAADAEQVDEHEEEEDFCSTVVGPDQLDVLQAACHLRQLFVGDWLVWANMGAYSMQNRAHIDDDLEDFNDDPAIYYVADSNYWDAERASMNSAASSSTDTDSVLSDEGTDDECAEWFLIDWASAFESRERAANSFGI